MRVETLAHATALAFHPHGGSTWTPYLAVPSFRVLGHPESTSERIRRAERVTRRPSRLSLNVKRGCLSRQRVTFSAARTSTMPPFMDPNGFSSMLASVMPHRSAALRSPTSSHQSEKGRENIPVAGTNQRRGERIYLQREQLLLLDSEARHDVGAGGRRGRLRPDAEGEPITSQGREYARRGSQSRHRGGNMPGGGSNHITGEGICPEGEPITSPGREYARRGSQSHHRGGNTPGGGANRVTGEGICPEGEPITSQGREYRPTCVPGGASRLTARAEVTTTGQGLQARLSAEREVMRLEPRR
eukprot:303891-Prorocentrum_minimum.AAC.1